MEGGMSGRLVEKDVGGGDDGVKIESNIRFYERVD